VPPAHVWNLGDRVGPLSVVDGRLPQVVMTRGWTSTVWRRKPVPQMRSLQTG